MTEAGRPSSDEPWQAELKEIERRRQEARELVDDDRVLRQRQRGHLTVRERLDQLLDRDSFREVGALAGEAEYVPNSPAILHPSTYVMGVGQIENRPVVVGAQDFTRRGGTSDNAAHSKKRYIEVMAADLLVPLVRLVDGAGGSVRSVMTLGRTYVPGDLFWQTAVQNLSRVPVVSACLGVAAGIDAALVTCSHFSIMTRENSCLFAAGPPVVRAGLGVDLTKEDLGGSSIHGHSGVVDNVADNEVDAIAQVRRFLSYLPSNVFELPPTTLAVDPPDGWQETLDRIVPRDRRKLYNPRTLLESIFDAGSIFELGRGFGDSAITALGRIDGLPIGIISFDPRQKGGAVTSNAADKMVRLMDLCETFHLPLVRIIDQPGVAIGPTEERSGAIRHAARLIAATYQGSTPSVNVIVRRCFGIAGGALNRMTGMHLRLGWPSARWGSIPVEGGVEAAYRREMSEADDPERLRQQYVQRVEDVASPFRTAEVFGVEEIIAPHETRAALSDWLRLARRRQEIEGVQPYLHGTRP